MEKIKKLFSFPRDQKTLFALINAIPDLWTWINGQLNAPPLLIASSQAIQGIGLHIIRYSEARHYSEGRSFLDLATYEYRAKTKRDRSNLLMTMLTERRLPGYVCFEEAGYVAEMPFKLCRNIALVYIKHGYVGWLEFAFGNVAMNPYPTEAVLRICWRSCRGSLVRREPHLELHYKTKRDEGDRPEEEYVEDLIGRFRSFGIHSIQTK